MLRLNPEGHRKVLEEGVEMQTIYLKGKVRAERGSRQPLPRDLWLFYYQPLTIQCFSLWKVSSNCEKIQAVSPTPCTEVVTNCPAHRPLVCGEQAIGLRL